MKKKISKKLIKHLLPLLLIKAFETIFALVFFKLYKVKVAKDGKIVYKKDNF